jgi:4a-hydroxytetrahydrobiopterin dehydratase
MMQPKIPEGQDEAKIKGELEALIQNGWKLDEEQIRLEKTYYFKTYTKVIVRESLHCPTCLTL